MAKVEEEEDCIYEVDYSETGEVGLFERKQKCEKNPEHKGFYSMKNLTLKDFPEGYKTTEMMKLIQSIADLTVRIRVSYTGMSRPWTFPETSRAYSGSELRGCSTMRVGTGFIGHVSLKMGKEGLDDDHCPCFHCRRSDYPYRTWGQVSVITAAHVVCSDDEVVHAELDCFYEDDEDRDTEVKVLYGNTMRACQIPVTKVNVSDDFCQFSVITHDIDLCQRLNRFKLNDLLTVDHGVASSMNEPITVIVSHPHGCSKCVSWGKSTSSETILVPDNPEKHRYFYDAPTCPGSSGSLVWMLESSQDKWQKIYVHSAGLKGGLNKSGSVEMFREYINSLVYCRIS